MGSYFWSEKKKLYRNWKSKRRKDKTENVAGKLFNLITEFDESKTFVKHSSCDCKCRFDAKKCDWSWV